MIFVFKTSVHSQRQVKALKPHLDTVLPSAYWNFDLTDRDRILRIDCEDNIVSIITALLQRHSFSCEELM